MSRAAGFAPSVFAAAAVALSTSASYAADPAFPPPILEKAPVAFVQEYRSGWYLRGDIGYRMNDFDGIDAVIGPVPSGNTIDDRFVFGGGAGYKSGWFRADVTIDWSPRTSIAAATPDYRMKLESVTTLANVYFDLGTWYGFTPYIGAGAGVSWNRTSDYFSDALLLPGLVGSGLKQSDWDFAWAATAGFSFNLSPNLLLDMSYRYLSYGDATAPIATNNNQLTLTGLTAQEFRVGLRYNLD